MKKKRKFNILLCFIIAITSSFSSMGSAFASTDSDVTYDSPTIEVKYSVAEDEQLTAGAEYTAEIWLYNVENVKRGTINFNGQYTTFNGTAGSAKDASLSSSVTWGEMVDSEKSKFYTKIVGIITCSDEMDLEFTEAVSADSNGVKVATIKAANAENGTVSLKLGGWGMRGENVVACDFKDENGDTVYKSNDGNNPIKVIYSYSAATSDPEPAEAWDSTWPSFRGNDYNNGITIAETPTSGATTALKWSVGKGEGYTNGVGPALLIGDYLYTSSADKLYRINKEDGRTEASITLAGSTGFNTVAPAYGKIGEEGSEQGVIFVSLIGGKMEAIEASSMRPLWTSESVGGQNQCPVLYDKVTQLVYTGYWSAEDAPGKYVCLDANTGEVKWKLENNGGFYWAGGVIIGDYLVVGSDNGNDGSGNVETSDYDLSTLYVLNKKTGEVVDSSKTLVGDQRSSITYDKSTGKIFFTTKGGYLYSAKIDSSGKIVELKGHKNDEGSQSTSTPVVHNERVYYGIGGGFTDNGKQFVVVADAETLEEIYRVPMSGYPQSSGLLSTAYDTSGDGTVYLYYTYNTPPGGVTVIKDKAGQTEAEKEELFEPVTGREYCLSSVIADTDGTLYYSNDSGYLFALEKNLAYLSGLTIQDDNGNEAVLKKSSSSTETGGFSPGYTQYTATVKSNANKARLNFSTPGGTTVKVNNEEVSDNSYSVDLSGELPDIEISVTNGDYNRTYSISLQRESEDSSLMLLGVGKSLMDYSFDKAANGEDGDKGLAKISSNPSPGVNDFTFSNINKGASDQLILYVKPNNSNAEIQLKALDKRPIRNTEDLDENDCFTNEKSKVGVFKNNDGESVKRTGYFIIKLKDDFQEGEVKLLLTVTAESGKREEYNLIIDVDDVAIEVTDATIQKGSGGYKFAFNSSEDGTLYYSIFEAGKKPGLYFLDEAQSVEIKKGANSVSLPDTTKAGQTLYYTTIDTSYNQSKQGSLDIPDTAATEPQIIVSFRLIGSTLSTDDVDLSKGDEGYYGAEYQTWIKTKSYTLSEGATVYDLFTKATAEAGISSVGASNDYVRTITAPSALGGYSLSEFTNGKRSGWMYTVNDSHPKVGLKSHTLQNNDSVVWHYVNDYSYEVADWSSMGGSQYPSLGDGTYYNSWLKAADVDPSSAVTPTDPTEPTEEVTVTGDVASKVTDGEATASVSGSTVNSLINDAVKDNAAVIDINVTGADNADKIVCEVPKASLDDVVSKTNASVNITTPVAGVELPQDAITGMTRQSDGDTVKMIVEKSALTGDNHETIGTDSVTVDVSIVIGDKAITDLGGKNISLTLPVPDSLGNEELAAAYIDDDGRAIAQEGKKITIDGKTYFKLTTEHLSVYTVGKKAAVDKAVKRGNFNFEGIELSKTEFIYTKKAKTPTVKSFGDLEAGTDYEISYKNNVKTGKAAAVIEGKGDLEGLTRTVEFVIKPYRGVINKMTSKRNSITVTCRNQKGGGITGYQFAWKRTGSKYKTYKTKMISSKNYKTTLRNLKKNTRYTVKVRGIVRIDGERVFGNWSKIKRINTK